MSATVVVSNRGPLTFRAGPDGALIARPGGGGLASSLHRILAGTGTTWASVTMGAADREAVAQGRMHEDGLDLVPVIVGDDTYRMAYDVVANSTLWYCHHHMWDLPLRPRFDRHWHEAWEGYRAYNRAMADAVVARADRGAAVLVQDYHFSLLGRMLAEPVPTCAPCTSCTPPSPHPPSSACCPTTCGPSCSTAWRATAPAASTATSGRPAFAPATKRPALAVADHLRGARSGPRPTS